MAREKRWLAVSPQNFTADGTVDGIITVASTSGFKVKQQIALISNTQLKELFQVKRVFSSIQLAVGPLRSGIDRRSDVSAFLTADSATIEAAEQARPAIPLTEHERAVYEEEPTVAKRVIDVDEFGNPYSKANPKPVDATVSVGNISVRLTRQDDDPNAGDVHDSARIGNNTLEWDFKDKGGSKGAGRVVDTLHCGGVSAVITIGSTPVEVKVGASAKVDRVHVYLQARGKGIFWGYNSDVDRTDGVKGGAPLGKNQPGSFSIEANTPIYLVGPAVGVKIFIAEA